MDHGTPRRGIRSRTAALAAAIGLIVGVGCAVTPNAGRCEGQDLDLVREGTLTVGVDLGHPPFAFPDPETREPTGFDLELLRAVSQRLNLEIRFVDQRSPGLVPALLARRFDVVASGLRAGEEIRAQACPTAPYLDTGLAVAVIARATPGIEEAADVVGPVAVERGTPGAAWARERFAEVRALPTASDVFADLVAGHVSAVVHDRPLVRYQRGLHAEFLVVEEIDTDEGYIYLVHPEQQGLRDAIEVALELLEEDGTYAGIFERWFGPRD